MALGFLECAGYGAVLYAMDVLAEIIEGPYDGTNSLSVITKVPFK